MYISLLDHSFSVSAPRLWNSLPIGLRNASTLNGFKIVLEMLLDNLTEQFIFVIF